MAGSIGIWLAIALLGCTIGRLTLGMPGEFYHADQTDQTTHDDLIKELSKELDVVDFQAQFKYNTPAGNLGSKVYELLAQTMKKNEADDRLNGLSVQQLLDINKWDSDKRMSPAEREDRKKICRTFFPEETLSLVETEIFLKEQSDDYLKRNLGAYCWSALTYVDFISQIGDEAPWEEKSYDQLGNLY